MDKTLVEDVPAEDAPGDVTAPEDVPVELFEDWCSTAVDCIEDGATSVDDGVSCVKGSCKCSGDYVDPGEVFGSEYSGWSCVKAATPELPSILMKYVIEWNSQDIDCLNRPAGFDLSLKEAMVSFFELTDFEMSIAYCGSIHFAGSGRSRLAGKPGFSDHFASNPNNPYGAPAVTGQKASLQVSCTPVYPQTSAVLLSGICQPVTCAEGYTLVNSGKVDVPSACVVTPPPGVIATGVPSPFVGHGGVVTTSDDSLSVGSALGISFGVAVFVGILIMVVVFFCKSSPSNIEQEEDNLQQEQQNNGPDKDDDFDDRSSLPQ
eukprot:TRINITY_DN2611_c1_g1_i1.p1 TRINITY_DN2611_c1_g1~~TRINITY_DN2611_c1_g1_i1.p1  ORF type:complete len:319 (+),score=61.52 TRINITY_DN2611_c1_g1_i1:45-1001(+)